MKKWACVLLPAVLGLGLGTLLFLLGNADDAPGLSALGLLLAFLLLAWSVYNARIIRKGFFSPAMLLCLGTGGFIFTLNLLFDKEFQDAPGLVLLGILISGLFLLGGFLLLKKSKK